MHTLHVESSAPHLCKNLARLKINFFEFCLKNTLFKRVLGVSIVLVRKSTSHSTCFDILTKLQQQRARGRILCTTHAMTKHGRFYARICVRWRALDKFDGKIKRRALLTNPCVQACDPSQIVFCAGTRRMRARFCQKQKMIVSHVFVTESTVI